MNNKIKRIAWGLTGSGHLLKESINIIESLENVDLFLSKAGEEVLKWYGYKLDKFKKKNIKIFKDVTASSAPVSFFYEDIYKALIVVFLSFLLFEFTIGQKIRKIDSKIENLNSKQEREKIANKLRNEIERANQKENILSEKDRQLLSKFINKIIKELNLEKSQ